MTEAFNASTPSTRPLVGVDRVHPRVPLACRTSTNRPPEPGQPCADVIVLDDHRMFATALAAALRAHGLAAQRIVLGQAGIVAHPRRWASSVVLLDLDLEPGEEPVEGLSLVARMRALGCAVLVLTGTCDHARIAAAVAAGATAAVPKSCSLTALLDTVRRVAAGQPIMSETDRQDWLRHHHTYQARQHELAQRLARLSRREHEVLELLSNGLRAADIAAHNHVSLTTVRAQIRAVLSKLDVSSQLEAVALARRYMHLSDPNSSRINS